MTPQSPTVEVPEEIFLLHAHGFALMRKRAEESLRPFGITPAEYHLLRVLQNDTMRTATELRKRLATSAPTVAQSIAALEYKGLIQRKQNKEDKRVQHITLSAKGEKVVEKARKSIVAGTNDLPLSEKEFSHMRNALQLVIQALSPSPRSS